MEALGAVSTAMDLGKKARELSKRLQDQELREILADQQDALLDVREENQQLREKVADMEARLQEKDDVWFDGELYWKGNEPDCEGPFIQCANTRAKKWFHCIIAKLLLPLRMGPSISERAEPCGTARCVEHNIRPTNSCKSQRP